MLDCRRCGRVERGSQSSVALRGMAWLLIKVAARAEPHRALLLEIC